MKTVEEIMALADAYADRAANVGQYEHGGFMRDARAALRAAVEEAVGWRPISEAPHGGRQMFVVRAFNVQQGSTTYNSDPWCVWREKSGSFARWPHKFPPTHWQPLPAPPAAAGLMGERA